MDASNSLATAALTAGFLDALADAPHTQDALTQIDRCRARIAGDGIFSIQQNVTTAQHADGQVLLRRFYSSASSTFPVAGTKRKTLTPWSECLFVKGLPFVGEGEPVLARTFDDFEQMRSFGLRSVVNVPLMQGALCFATFNVFGTGERWSPDQVLALRLLALTAARWVPAAPGLGYTLATSVATPAASPAPIAAEALRAATLQP